MSREVKDEASQLQILVQVASYMEIIDSVIEILKCEECGEWSLEASQSMLGFII